MAKVVSNGTAIAFPLEQSGLNFLALKSRIRDLFDDHLCLDEQIKVFL